jgi:type II secretory pathway pseudopilin PulG
MASSVREFIYQMYRLITASNPVVPLHGDDESLAIRVMNQILRNYASSGLMLTIAKTVSVDINLPVKEIWFTEPDYIGPVTTQTETVTLTAISPNFTVVDGTLYSVGDLVTGRGIPDLTYILAITVNTITLTKNATLSGASTLTFSHEIPHPNVVYIKEGRLANLDSSWLDLSGVTYPLIDKSRDEFLAAWKYEPLQGLPRFIITFPDTKYVRAQLYPAPSQFYTFFARGKFQKTILTSSDTLEGLPEYFELFFLYAVAKYVSKFKGRGSAWTDDLEAEYRELKNDMEAASEVNLSIAGDEQSLLNGAWRVRAGI